MKNDDVNDFFQDIEPLENNQGGDKKSPINNDKESGLHPAVDDEEFKKEKLRSMFDVYFEEVWPAFARAFWAAFGIIDTALFKRFKVFYLSHYYRMSNRGEKFRVQSTEANPIFAFEVQAKPNAIKKSCYYLYRPFDPKYKHSWVGEKPFNHLWGLEQIPEKPTHIIIAAGPKDVLQWTNLGFNAVTANCENAKIYPGMFSKLLDKVGLKGRILLAYDNDDTGNKKSFEIGKEFGVGNLNQEGYIPNDLVFPDGKKVKDISDVVKYYLINNNTDGLKKYQQHLANLIRTIVTPAVFPVLFDTTPQPTYAVMEQKPAADVKQDAPVSSVMEDYINDMSSFEEVEEIAPATPVTAAPASVIEPPKEKKRIRTANERMKDAESEPELSPVLGEFVKKTEIAVIYGDTGIGKTLLGIDASDSLSFGTGEALGLPSLNEPANVLYYDCELSDPMFRNRYLGYTFSDNFKIVVMNGLVNGEFSYEAILDDIKQTGASIVIVDNITKLSQSSNTEIDVARGIMEQLQKLRDAAKVSIIVFAHIIKVKANSPISLNHLGGSKYISNIADSVVALARSAKGKDIRYLKHVKKRNGAEDDKVHVYEIVKHNNFLRFNYLGMDTERNQLKGEGEKSPMIEQAKKFKAEGKSVREIAKLLGVSKSTIVIG